MKLVTHKTVFTKCRTGTLITLGLFITSATAFPPPPGPDETWQQVLNVQGQWISSSSTYRLSWDGRENETYFVQYSTTLVNDWIFMPGIAQGVGIWDVNLSGSNEPVGFLRILPRIAVGDNEDTDDHDGDGIGNLAEISSNPQTSPLNWDTDGDGMNDGWEVLMNFDPTVAGTGAEDPAGDSDSDNYTNLMESLLGLNPVVGIESTSASGANLEIYIPH